MVRKFIVRNLEWFILFICMLLFVKILRDVYSEGILDFDSFSYNLICKYFMSDSFTTIMKFITMFGGGYYLIILSLLSFLIKNKKYSFCICFNLSFVAFLNFILKNIVERSRPIENQLVSVSGYSFPSGHSMVSMAFYGFIIYLVYKFVKNKTIKYLVIFLLSVLIIMIGFSRVYLGVHYTSDVVAGLLISLSYSIIYIKVINRFILKNG